MRIDIYGLGYVGSVSAACLAAQGHDVLGIDIDRLKVDRIIAGSSAVVEPHLDSLVAAGIASGRLRATINGTDRTSDIAMICVGTPSNENGSLCLDYVKRAAIQIASSLAESNYQVVCVRSTVLPGTVRNVIVPLLEEHSGKKAGLDFGVCMNPEFLREGSSIVDFERPPLTLVGQLDGRSGDLVAELYSQIDAPLVRTELSVAEMVKYACNAYHGLKVAFANEIGRVCKRAGLDAREVMRIFCLDPKLNVSPAYLKPGFAFGGSCLPKDLRALLHKAKELDVNVALLDSILESNSTHVLEAYRLVKNTAKRRVAMLGLSFKPGTDDLRESPLVSLVELLLGKGYDMSIYDKEVLLGRLHGANRAYIETVIPHVSRLMKQTVDEALQGAEVIIVGKQSSEYMETLQRLPREQHVIDLASLFGDSEPAPNYEGICW